MSRNRKGPTGREGFEEIESRLGDLFGSLGSALNSVIDMANDAQARDGKAMERNFDISNGPIRAQSSIRVRVGGLDGKDDTRDRDVTKPVNQPESRAAQRETTRSPREPVVDAFVDGGYWVLTAEMPGISQDAVSVDVDGQKLLLSADGRQSYRIELEIPKELDAASLEHAVTNGILELRGRLKSPGGAG